MHPKRVLSFAATVIPAAALTLLPGEARAQPHGGHGHGHVSVGVGIGVGYGYPVYAAPYFYNPYWWGFYGGFSTGFWGYPSFAYPPYPYPGYGYFDASADLRVQVMPRTAEVYVDGYLVGTVDDFDGVFQRVHMPLGEHQITIYSPGHRSITERMLFRPFESYKIKDTLQPLPAGEADEPRPAPSPAPPRPQGPPRGGPPMEGPPPESGNQVQLQLQQGDQHFGAVAVRVQPADAEILIDGERWEAPAGERVQVQLTPGSHRVEVRKSGFRTYSSSVDVRSGQTVTVNVSLSPQ
ncbi:MAG: PEGA domain-containing protein [Acidobacteria bacterium]|nr:PEGA domain-containing protein [Acidobacteriota bacterium]